MNRLPYRATVSVFLAFACAYFLSALVRAITATLSPVLTQEFSLHARDLGLLSGGYFLGFALTQLPLGSWLDRYGPKRVLVCFLSVAVIGCLAFARVGDFASLLAARVLCGVGVSACLMAPLTGYRRWFSPAAQMRANSWMLMTGSLGMIAATLPVQWLLPILGWRSIFLCLAALLVGSMALIAWRVPGWPSGPSTLGGSAAPASYAEVWRHPVFRAMAPVGFFCYGGLVAMQTLWAVPWVVTMGGFSALEAATALFWINVSMLGTFWAWGMGSQWLARNGHDAAWLLTWWLPVSFVVLGLVILTPAVWPNASGALLALFCVTCSVVTPSQPAVGMAFAPELAGRALSAYNLVIFSGVFAIQWGIGLCIDGLMAFGLARPLAFQWAFGAYLACAVLSYVYFLWASRHNRRR
jgi:MFS family permease